VIGWWRNILIGDPSMTAKQLAKSKTINFNALIAAIAAASAALGYPLPPGYTEAALIIGNIILRLVTKEAISDK